LLITVPVIAVFTKYDLLVTRTKRNLDTSICAGLSPEQILELAKKEADAILQRDCVGPFDVVVEKQVPYMTVSSESNCTTILSLSVEFLDTISSAHEEYRDTLSKLIELTYSHVRKHVAEEASIVTAIAQKVSPGVKIDGSIA
jgi:hypothetical protein